MAKRTMPRRGSWVGSMPCDEEESASKWGWREVEGGDDVFPAYLRVQFLLVMLELLFILDFFFFFFYHFRYKPGISVSLDLSAYPEEFCGRDVINAWDDIKSFFFSLSRSSINSSACLSVFPCRGCFRISSWYKYHRLATRKRVHLPRRQDLDRGWVSSFYNISRVENIYRTFTDPTCLPP